MRQTVARREAMADLVNVAVEELVRQRRELPPFGVLWRTLGDWAAYRRLVNTPFKLYSVLMNGKELVKYLQERGWVVDRIHGSYLIMVKDGHRPIPVPVHGARDLPVGLVRSILRESKEE